jgi:hypothetical protein
MKGNQLPTPAGEHRLTNALCCAVLLGVSACTLLLHTRNFMNEGVHMPRGRPRSTGGFVARNGLEQLVYEIGQRLGRVMVDGLRSSLSHAVPASGTAVGKVKRGPGRPRRAGASESCVVPECGRRAVAKGLCATHYRKARRLRMGDKLSASNLSELAEDGRKTRFKKAA